MLTGKSRVAIALASLAIVVAFSVSLGMAVQPDEVVAVWTRLALLVVPSTGAFWYLGRRRRPSRPWIFLWIVVMAVGLGGLISSLGLGAGPGRLDVDYGQAGVFLLVVAQTGSSLWAAASL